MTINYDRSLYVYFTDSLSRSINTSPLGARPNTSSKDVNNSKCQMTDNEG